ncbi:MAG: LPS export ABC transporter periplasmic protein LptC [Alphaproteobacteria bacterium]
MNDSNPAPENKSPKLSGLSRSDNDTRRKDQGYSAFIRSMRIVLPLTALAIIAVLFSWNIFRPDEIAPAKPGSETAKTIGKNELLNPRFDSVDAKNRPYTITAARALQGADNELMLLDAPMADIILRNGNWLAVKSRQGAFRQETQRLLLKDDVRLFHDEGYSAKTQELDVDLKAGTARSDVKITGHGPLGTLDASGMYADSKAGHLIFTGPAKIVFYDTGGSSNKGLLIP